MSREDMVHARMEQLKDAARRLAAAEQAMRDAKGQILSILGIESTRSSVKVDWQNLKAWGDDRISSWRRTEIEWGIERQIKMAMDSGY